MFEVRRNMIFKSQQHLDMLNADGSSDDWVNPTQNSSTSNENNVSDNDVVIDDVLPKSKTKKSPLLTKKGKITLALIVLGFFAYELYTRNKAKKEMVANAPTPTPSPNPNPTPEPPKAEEGAEVESSDVNEENPMGV